MNLTMITCTACGGQFFDADDHADHALDQHGFTDDGLHDICGHFHDQDGDCPDRRQPCGDYRCCIN